MSEGPRLEYKERYDPDSSRDRLRLVKEIVAMANSGGGEIRIGVADSGDLVGVDQDTVTALDPARLVDLIEKFIRPDTLQVGVRREPVAGTERSVVVLDVPPFSDPPLVLTRDGNYEEGGQQNQVFAKDDVYVRHGTQARRARREDYRNWIKAAINREMEGLKANLKMVMALPADQVVISTGDAPGLQLASPAQALETAVRNYRHNPARLLTSTELLQLFLVRDSLTIDREKFRVLFQSALRRKATLYFWVADHAPDAGTIYSELQRVFETADRDKSDAASSVMAMAALYLMDEQFNEIRQKLLTSRYAHFREAAAEAPTRQGKLELLAQQRRRRLLGRVPEEWTTRELVDEATSIARDALATGSTSRRSRALARLGFEYLVRMQRFEPLLPARPGSHRKRSRGGA